MKKYIFNITISLLLLGCPLEGNNNRPNKINKKMNNHINPDKMTPDDPSAYVLDESLKETINIPIWGWQSLTALNKDNINHDITKYTEGNALSLRIEIPNEGNILVKKVYDLNNPSSSPKITLLFEIPKDKEDDFKKRCLMMKI